MPLEASTERQVLEFYPGLAALGEDLRKRLRKEGQFAGVDAGRTVFEPSQFCILYPLLLRGTARVFKVGESAPDTFLYRLQPGEHCLLSSSALLARWRFGARVIAESDLEAVVIPAPLFRSMVKASEPFASSVYVAVARRLEVVMQLVEQTTHFRLDQRVASLLLARGRHLTMTHQELADDLAASREHVSRVLESFRERGWLFLGRRQIEVVDASGLETVLEPRN